jgi:hypothetical protein
MPDLNFRITGVAPATRGLVPLLHFKLEVANTPASEQIHSAMIQVQIQFEVGRRKYNAAEKEKLSELFGSPERWGQTLRTRLWAHASTTLRSFAGSIEALLPVPCTYDLNVSGAKYFYGLEEGEVPLLFLFSGTVFYATDDGRLQVQQISWEKECSYRMPVREWQGLMDHHYPQSAWLSLHRDAFDKLYAYKREHGLTTWEQVVDRLLPEPQAHTTPAPSAVSPP